MIYIADSRGTLFSRGKRRHRDRSRKKPRRPGSTVRGKRRGAPIVDVSGRRR